MSQAVLTFFVPNDAYFGAVNEHYVIPSDNALSRLEPVKAQLQLLEACYPVARHRLVFDPNGTKSGELLTFEWKQGEDWVTVRCPDSQLGQGGLMGMQMLIVQLLQHCYDTKKVVEP